MKNNVFRRLILPGLAFKAVVIGGGYATGRELAAYFLPSGPRGGVLGMFLAAGVWSLICSLTFIFALQTGSRDYRTFFRNLLGPLWPAFEVTYFGAMIVILAVFAAAAGAIFRSVFELPDILGSLALIAGIAMVVAWGNTAVERLFGYVSLFLYATYVVFFTLALTRFGHQALAAFQAPSAAPPGWAIGGLTYAGYNVVGAVAILPVVRHMTGRRDALVAGMLAGPLAMLPAFLFFIGMVAFYPTIANEALPSDYMLRRIGVPAFRLIFQIMILSALLESGVGLVNGVNERVSAVYARRRGRGLGRVPRLAVTLAVLVFSVFVASRFGLVQLIAGGYRWLSYAILAIYVLPLISLGLWRIYQGRRSSIPLDPLLAADNPTSA